MRAPVDLLPAELPSGSRRKPVEELSGVTTRSKSSASSTAGRSKSGAGTRRPVAKPAARSAAGQKERTSKEKERAKKKPEQRVARPAKKPAAAKSSGAAPKPRRALAQHRVAAKPMAKRQTASPKPKADTRAVIVKRPDAASPVPVVPVTVAEPERAEAVAAAPEVGRSLRLEASESPPTLPVETVTAPRSEPAEAESGSAAEPEAAAPGTPAPEPPQIQPLHAASEPIDRPVAAPAPAPEPEQPAVAATTTQASIDEGMSPDTKDDDDAEQPHTGRNGAVIPFRRPLAVGGAPSGTGIDEEFHEGDHVVYPTHGVGKVERIATEDIAGHRLELIHITFEENRMTLRVPVAKARSAGLRKLASRALFNEALAVLKGRARIKRTMWSRRAQEYEAKINSGDPLAIAEVVRDLHRNAGQPDQSFSERQIYEAAMDRLAAELAALDQTDKPTAVTKLADFLKPTEAAKPVPS